MVQFRNISSETILGYDFFLLIINGNATNSVIPLDIKMIYNMHFLFITHYMYVGSLVLLLIFPIW